MVVQNYDVLATSQREYVSIKSSTMLAIRNPGASAQNWLTSSRNAIQNINGSANQNTPQNGGDTAALSKQHPLGFPPGQDGKEHPQGMPPGQMKKLQQQIRDDSIAYLSAKSKERASRTHGAAQSGVHGKRLPSNPDELRLYLMELLFEQLKVSRRGASSYTMTSDGTKTAISQSESFNFALSYFGSFFGVPAADGSNAGAVREGWRIESFAYESEQVSYQAQGVVNTADGRTISFDINMYMSRQFVEYTGIDIEAARNLCDPLVINYNGTAASLTGETFSFDLTSDGVLEKLAALGEGCGFLALDKNGDGIINDGSELFGPNSGCGFSELREYDKDFNGWIDEADEVFGKLIVWARDKDGNDTAYTLKELGIGAIFLGDIATEFSFKDDDNQTLGIMRSTSFFLKEDGGAGFVSHIDLSV